MSVQAMTWVLDSVRGFKPAERLVLLSIANHADPHGKNAWPSIKTIADEADMSVASVYRALESLAGTGILLVTKHAGGSAGLRDTWRPNLYELNYEVVSPPDGHRDHGGLSHHKADCRCRVCGPSQLATPDTPLASCEPETSQVATTPLATCVVEPSIETPVEPSTTPPYPPTLELVIAPTPSPVSAAQTCVERVFAEWQEATKKPRAVLDPKRRRVIQQALRLYPLEDVVDAVWGWRASEFHCGINDRKTVYNDLSLLLRNAETIERFRDLRRGDVLSPPSVREYRDQQLMARIRADQALGF